MMELALSFYLMISYDILSSSIFVQFLKVLSTFPHLDFTMCKVHQLILRGKKTTEFTNLNQSKQKLRFMHPIPYKHHLLMMVRGILLRIKLAG